MDLAIGVIVVVTIILFLVALGGGTTPDSNQDDSLTTAVKPGPDVAQGSSSEPLEVRLREEQVQGNHSPYLVQRVEARGCFPVPPSGRLGFVLSVLDVTDLEQQEYSPAVVSSLANCQEPDTECFQDRIELGSVNGSMGYRGWTAILKVIPETLIPPVPGPRKLLARVCAIDLDSPPTIRHGFLDQTSGANEAIQTWYFNFDWDYRGGGWHDQWSNQTESEELTIRIAIAVAMADGRLDQLEGETIKAWVRRRLKGVAEDNRDERKARLNRVMKSAYRDRASHGSRVVAELRRLREISDQATRMAAIELALNVLAADGQVDASSLAFVTTCADELGVDADMFAAARDSVLTRTGVSLGTDVDFERLLGIRPDWPSAQIRSHLNREYARWNSRAEALVADDERKHAEQMMEIIASAKKALLT